MVGYELDYGGIWARLEKGDGILFLQVAHAHAAACGYRGHLTQVRIGQGRKLTTQIDPCSTLKLRELCLIYPTSLHVMAFN
jgi:hypothetical protein